jgi:hypothetical protein
LGNLPSTILWTWPYHVSWFCSISFIIGSSNPICCLIVFPHIFYFFQLSILTTALEENHVVRGVTVFVIYYLKRS